MKTSDLIASINTGKFNCSEIIPEEINAHEIMSISDFKVLKEISKQRNKFEFLRKTDTWPKNSDRQYRLGSMDRLCEFLRTIEASTCRCVTYKYTSPDPKAEENLGFVKITRQSEESFQPYYECLCTACNSAYKVTVREVRFGHQIFWEKTKNIFSCQPGVLFHNNSNIS